MKKNLRAFLDELVELCKKHNVTLESEDNYDGRDEFAGTDYHFTSVPYSVVEGDRLSLKQVQEAIESPSKRKGATKKKKPAASISREDKKFVRSLLAARKDEEGLISVATRGYGALRMTPKEKDRLSKVGQEAGLSTSQVVALAAKE